VIRLGWPLVVQKSFITTNNQIEVKSHNAINFVWFVCLRGLRPRCCDLATWRGQGQKMLGLDRAMGVRKFCEKILRANTVPCSARSRRIRFERVEGFVMITKAVIALILFGLTSSANAMTVIFKDYKAANNDERAFYFLYLDGVKEGIIELNVVLEEKRPRPLFCLPGKLALTVGQAEDIMMRQAEKITDPDQLPIGLLLAQGLQNTFPCDEKH
jgi:Ssp1 endopeptidase immunity protein Rap1a